MEYEAAKDMMLKARHAISGSPSPWKVLAIMAKEATEMEKRVMLSVEESEDTVAEEDMVVCRRTMLVGFEEVGGGEEVLKMNGESRINTKRKEKETPQNCV